MTQLNGWELPAPATRAADSDREAVAERLRLAAGEGRLETAELTERLELAYAARTYAELAELVVDLPADGTAPGTGTLLLKTHMTPLRQTGRWTVPQRIAAECGMLNILIDFTEATCLHREVTLEATCGMGTVQVVVPKGWDVLIDPASTNTARIAVKPGGPVDPTDPVLRIVGHPRTGQIRVKRARR
ncbi:DUF1707 domain-containing protein [Streptomyces sp. NPDC089919]|uniref:DUF1707 SHOCT-like domain-containing protein n=1 Tax=Streptomyces sp. NPDC089919 TaxID=3155188 RepID=UPI003424E9B7